MTAFELKYTPTRRTAIFEARFAQATTYERIAEQAQSGELVPGDPFTINAEYVARLCRAEAKKRKGQHNSLLADKPHRDAIETLRRRLIATADVMSADLLALAEKDSSKVDPVRFRQVITCVKEAAAIPAPKDERPPAPGQQAGSVRHGEKTRSGPGGSLLEAARATVGYVAENAEEPAETGSNGAG